MEFLRIVPLQGVRPGTGRLSSGGSAPDFQAELEAAMDASEGQTSSPPHMSAANFMSLQDLSRQARQWQSR